MSNRAGHVDLAEVYQKSCGKRALKDNEADFI